MPNPFYQAYGAAALAVGAEPVPVPATAETGFLPDYAAPAAGAPRPRHARLRLLAVEPAGRGRRRRLLARPPRARRAPRLPHPRRRVLRRDLPRHPAARRAGDGRRRRRRPRAGGDLPLALQALERPGPARRASPPAARARSRRCASSAPTAARPCPCRCSAPPPRSGSDEAHVDGEPRALPREVRARRPHPRQHAGLHPAAGRLLPLAPGRRRRGGGAPALPRDRRAGAARRLPRPRHRRRPEPRRAPTSASRWSRTPPRSSAGLGAIRDDARARRSPRKGSDRWLHAARASAARR